MTCVTASASEANSAPNSGIMPLSSHTNNVVFSFSANSNGGIASVYYRGYSSFVKAELTVKVQKRFLLVFWSDIGEWSTSSTDVNPILEHIFTLDGSGTYRASFTLVITGNDGTVDTITDTIESKY